MSLDILGWFFCVFLLRLVFNHSLWLEPDGWFYNGRIGSPQFHSFHGKECPCLRAVYIMVFGQKAELYIGVFSDANRMFFL